MIAIFVTASNATLANIVQLSVPPACPAGKEDTLLKFAKANLKTERQLSERRACGLMNISTSVLRYRAQSDTNGQLHERIVSLAGQRRRLAIAASTFCSSTKAGASTSSGSTGSTAMRDWRCAGAVASGSV